MHGTVKARHGTSEGSNGTRRATLFRLSSRMKPPGGTWAEQFKANGIPLQDMDGVESRAFLTIECQYRFFLPLSGSVSVSIIFIELK
jgi:hypothetical protein